MAQAHDRLCFFLAKNTNLLTFQMENNLKPQNLNEVYKLM